ncbi:MAG: hypothetical protein RJB13_664 [Pseudomonadota bacterium]
MFVDALNRLGWLFYAVSAIFASSIASEANANQTKINFNFVTRQVVFYGLYVPQSENKADGLSAELYARRDGIAHLTAKLQESCNGIPVSEGTVRPSSNAGWISSVRSLGSEIYNNGVLKISLTAPVREVFKEFPSSSFVLRSKSGAPLVLRFPVIPLDKITCGKLSVHVGSKKVDVNPFAVTRESSAQSVQLVFRGATLVPSKSEDIKTLEESNLFASLSASKDADSTSKIPAVTSPVNE